MDRRQRDGTPNAAPTWAGSKYKPFSQPWWILVLMLAPVGSALAYFRWVSPNPYPVLWIVGGAVSFVVLSALIAVLQRWLSPPDR